MVRSVCLYVSHISPMERLFVLKTLSHTQRATKICGDLPETTAFKSYATNQYCDLPGRGQLSLSEVPEYPTIVNNIQPCPKRCLLMPLTRVVARTESTTLHLHARRGQFPRTRIDTVKAVCSIYTSRVLHFILFLRALKIAIFANSPKFAKFSTRY